MRKVNEVVQYFLPLIWERGPRIERGTRRPVSAPDGREYQAEAKGLHNDAVIVLSRTPSARRKWGVIAN